jgi:hypothetical protein
MKITKKPFFNENTKERYFSKPEGENPEKYTPCLPN